MWPLKSIILDNLALFRGFQHTFMGLLKEIDGKMFIGLSFLFIEMKELCEARAKLEMSSNFQIYPQGINLTDCPHLKLPEHWVNSLLSNVANENPFEMVN